MQRAARVLVTSRYSAERAREFYGLAAQPARGPRADRPGRMAPPAGHQSGAIRRGFTVLFVGRLYRRKRVDVLLRAAAQLRERIPGLEVRIVGDGPCAGAASRAWRATCSWKAR